MMGGSGMPTPSEFWQNTVIADYIDPATHGNYTPVLVPTPESLPRLECGWSGGPAGRHGPPGNG